MKHTVCQLFVFVSILFLCALTLPVPGQQTAAPAAVPAVKETEAKESAPAKEAAPEKDAATSAAEQAVPSCRWHGKTRGTRHAE